MLSDYPHQIVIVNLDITMLVLIQYVSLVKLNVKLVTMVMDVLPVKKVESIHLSVIVNLVLMMMELNVLIVLKNV
jgi:hypothetical protein